MSSFRVWEGSAAQLRAELGLEDTILHPKILASRYELDVRSTSNRRGSCTDRTRVFVDVHATPEQRAFDLAHELGHFALDRYNEEQSEQGASYVAGALLLPRRPLTSALRLYGWDLGELRRVFLHASPEAIARRIVEVTDAVATITDGRRVLARVASPWLPPPRQTLTRDEQSALRRALDSGVRVDDGWISAMAFIRGEPARRVILIADYEQLSMRY